MAELGEGYDKGKGKDSPNSLVVFRKSAERDAAVRREKADKYNARVGVSRMVDAISKSKLPVIGHNAMCVSSLLSAYPGAGWG